MPHRNESPLIYSAGGVVRTPIRTVPHPSYDAASGANDIALVELNAPVSYRTTEWFSAGDTAAVRSGDATTAIGWGQLNQYWTENAPPLQQVGLSYQGAGSACDTYYGAGIVPSTLACIGPTSGAQDTCPQDSGGPDYARVAGVWKELGVVSRGGLNLFNTCGVSNRPGLYSVTSSAASFLRSNLPSAEGRLQTQVSDGLGATTTKTTTTALSSRWDAIVAGQFNGTSTADAVAYDSAGKQIRLYTSDADAKLTASAVQTGFSASISLLSSARVTTDAFDDLIAYDPVAGSLRVYGNSGTGSFAALGNPRTDVGGAVKNMVVGNFDGDTLIDVLLYTPSTGTGRVYEISNAGSISLIKTSTGWSKSWEIILAGNFSAEATSDLVFFAPSTGYILPGQFGGTSYADLFLYNPLTGLTKTFSTDGAGNITLLKEVTWRKTWLRIAPGNVNGTSHTDLFLYDRWVRP